MSNAAFQPLAPAFYSSEPWSEVRANDHVMRYRRTGAGPSVLLAAADDCALWPELPQLLAARFRLIVPELAPCAATIDPSALTSFLEGLGTPHVGLIASGGLCMPALELALRNPDQITRVVLVPDGAGDGGLDGSLMSSPQRDAIPLLVVHRGVAAEDAVPLIERFLSDPLSS